MILLSLFWRTSLFVASLYYSFSIHLVFNALSLFCRSPNCHISPQLPPLPLAHPPSLHKLPNSPVPLLHPVPTVDYSSSLRSILFLQYSCFVVFIGNSSSLILFLSRPFGHFFLVITVYSVAKTNLCTSPFVKFFYPTHSFSQRFVGFPHFICYPPPTFSFVLVQFGSSKSFLHRPFNLLFAHNHPSLPTY